MRFPGNPYNEWLNCMHNRITIKHQYKKSHKMDIHGTYMLKCRWMHTYMLCNIYVLIMIWKPVFFSLAEQNLASSWSSFLEIAEWIITRFHYGDVIMGAISVSNHQPRDCLLNRLFRCRSRKTSGPCLNIKTVLSMYGDFHVKDKTAVRTSYL